MRRPPMAAPLRDDGASNPSGGASGARRLAPSFHPEGGVAGGEGASARAELRADIARMRAVHGIALPLWLLTVGLDWAVTTWVVPQTPLAWFLPWRALTFASLAVSVYRMRRDPPPTLAVVRAIDLFAHTGAAFGINAFSFLVSAALVWSVRGRFQERMAGAARTVKVPFMEGIRLVFRTRILLAVVAAEVVAYSIVGWAMVADAPLAKLFGVGAVGFAALISTWGIGMLIGSSKLAYDVAYPLLVGFSSIPKVAVVPIFVVWFGAGTVPAVLTSMVISIFPVVVNVATGLASTEPELEDVLKVLGASRRDVLWNVSLPRAMPYLFASLKIAITLAFVGTVLAETVAANRGIGNVMIIASGNFDVALVFSGLVILAALGVMLYLVSSWLESRVTGWAQRKGDMAMV